MNSRRFAASFVAALVLASVALAAPPQRKTGGSAKGEGPEKEMKAGGKPRIFVATSAGGNENWTNDITRQSLEEALVNSGRFEVIAGTQRDNLLHEQGFANSDVVDPNESVKVGRDNTLELSMVCQGLDKAAAKEVWKPFFEWVDASPSDYTVDGKIGTGAKAARDWWDPAGDSMTPDPRPGAPKHHTWWKGDQGQVGAYLHGYDSTWLPAALLRPARRRVLADALFASASRNLPICAA